MVAPMNTSSAHASRRSQLQDWITSLMAAHGIEDYSKFARRVGVADSTISRLMNPSSEGHQLRESTIARIETAFNARRPSAIPVLSRPGLGERIQPEADFSVPETMLDKIRHDIQPLLTTREDGGETGMAVREALLVSDRALDLAGYLPGDVVLVDMDAQPATQDIVAVRWLTGQRPSDQITLRIFDTPFLTAHSTDESLRRPVLIDPARVQLIGVVRLAIRDRV